MKFLKSVKIITALVLTLTIIMLLPLQTAAAAENNGKYVSEVYVAYGKDANEAKKTLSDKGFTPVEGNLNDGGKTFAMMGYKTTDDIRDSITDLAVMNMRGDYSVEDYKKLLKGQKTEIAEFLDEFMTVIKEYRYNLKEGKAKAIYVHDLLNNYIEDDTGMKMGDLLNSETLQDKVGVSESIEAENPENLPDLVTILLQGNAPVIKSIETVLLMATDTSFNTWVDRFADVNYDGVLGLIENERPELNTEAKQIQYADNVYGETADVLAAQSAEVGRKLRDYAYSGFWIWDTTEEEIRNKFGDIENDANAMLRYQEWVRIAMLYENLNNFEYERFKKGELLSFFMTPEDYADEREIYIPMAFALSKGQFYGLPFVDLEQLLIYAFTTDESWKEYVEKNKAEFNKPEDVSVYQNIDRDLYKEDGSVALTGAAQRANNTADGTTGTKEAQMDTLSKIAAISWAATAGCAVVTLGSMVARHILVNSDTILKYEEGLEYVFEDQDTYGIFITDKGADATAFESARFSVKLSRIFMVVTLAVAVFSAVMTIIDLCRDKSFEQLPIPNYLVDNYTDADGGSYSLNYKAVECNRMDYFGADYKKQKGNSADLNADEGKQWLVLYASKNSKAGKPLTPNFIVQEKSAAPTGYEGVVHLIGEKGAINVVSPAFKDYSTFSTVWQNITGDYTKFIFCKLSNDTKTYDEAAGNMTATAMSGGMIAIIGLGGLALGAALGAIITVLINKKKKETA
nr:hypothetical protein [uncultured Ruminococcus sp.]